MIHSQCITRGTKWNWLLENQLESCQTPIRVIGNPFQLRILSQCLSQSMPSMTSIRMECPKKQFLIVCTRLRKLRRITIPTTNSSQTAEVIFLKMLCHLTLPIILVIVYQHRSRSTEHIEHQGLGAIRQVLFQTNILLTYSITHNGLQPTRNNFSAIHRYLLAQGNEYL